MYLLIHDWRGRFFSCSRLLFLSAVDQLQSKDIESCYLPIAGGGDVDSYLLQGYQHISECNGLDWNSNSDSSIWAAIHYSTIFIPAIRNNTGLYWWADQRAKVKEVISQNTFKLKFVLSPFLFCVFKIIFCSHFK